MQSLKENLLSVLFLPNTLNDPNKPRRPYKMKSIVNGQKNKILQTIPKDLKGLK